MGRYGTEMTENESAEAEEGIESWTRGRRAVGNELTRVRMIQTGVLRWEQQIRVGVCCFLAA